MYKVTLINDDVETVIHSPYFNDLKVQSGQIKQAINVADGFTFDIMPNNPGYNLINPLKTLVRVDNMQAGKVEFNGRVLMPTESMSATGEFGKSFLCESILGFLSDSAQRHGEYHDISVSGFLQVIIDNHNADVDASKRFTLGVVDVDSSTGTLYRYLGYESTWEAINDKLINRLGGEIRARETDGVKYIDYVKEFGEHKTTEIRLAKNLKSITKEVDPTEIITRLIPLGENIASEDENATDAAQARLTIADVNNGKDYIDDVQAMAGFGVITKSEVWNDITQANILKTRGLQFLSENNRVKSKHVLSALDLSLIGLDTDSFDLYNYYPVINPVMNINESMRVVEKTTDIISPENNGLIVGDKFKTASDYQKEANQSQVKVTNLENTVKMQRALISTIRNEMITVETNITTLQDALANADIEGLPDAISALENAITNLNDALDDIPVYDLATQTHSGLMAAADKVKLDGLQSYNEATDLVSGLMSFSDKQKLDLITVTQAIDLDDVITRLNNLEGV